MAVPWSHGAMVPWWDGATVPWCHGGHPGKFLSGAGDALSNPPYVFLRVYTLTFKTL